MNFFPKQKKRFCVVIAWTYGAGSVRMRQVLERHLIYLDQHALTRQVPEMFSGDSTGVEPNGFNSPRSAEIDRADIHLADTGLDPFARLFSGETLSIVAQPWWALGV